METEHRARALTSLMGMEDNDPWMVRVLFESVRCHVHVGEVVLEEVIGEERSAAVADILMGMDGSAARKSGRLFCFQNLLVVGKEIWMDPESSPAAAFLLEMPVGVSLVLEKDTRSVTICLNVSDFMEEGARLLDSLRVLDGAPMPAVELPVV